MAAKKKPAKKPIPPMPKPTPKKKSSMQSNSKSPGAGQVQNRQRGLEKEIIKSGLVPKPKRGQSLISLTAAAYSNVYGREFNEQEWKSGPGKQGYDAAVASAAKKMYLAGKMPKPKKKR